MKSIPHAVVPESFELGMKNYALAGGADEPGASFARAPIQAIITSAWT
jgi:hypothetical protein